MSWSRKKAEDKMVRLLGACEDPGQAVKWAPHLANFCEEISELAASASKRRQAEILTVLLRAVPYFAGRGQVGDLMRWVDPMLQDPAKNLVDDVFVSITDALLGGDQWSGILGALDNLQAYAARRGETRVWVAYAKALTNTIDALYSQNRFATADAAHERFEAVPAKFRSVTRLYQSQALVSKAENHLREGDGGRVLDAAQQLQEVYKEQPSEALRRNVASGAVAAIQVLVEEGKLERCLERAELLFAMVRNFPEDTALGMEYLHHLAAALPYYLEAGAAADPLARMVTLLDTFRDPDPMGEACSELLLGLAEAQPQLVQEQLDQLKPLLEVVERRFARRSLTAAERCARFRGLAGMPARSAGCLVLLALGAASGGGLAWALLLGLGRAG